jgi:hypothetical protein
VALPNPGHDQTGRTPPLSVFAGRNGIQRWKCHGCGDSGTAIDLALRTGNADGVADALDFLSGDDRRTFAPIPSRSRPPHTVGDISPATRAGLEAYTAGCVEHLHRRAGRPVLAWLTERRAIPLDVIAEARLGADPAVVTWIAPMASPACSPPSPSQSSTLTAGSHTYTLSRHVRPVASRWWNTAERAAPNPHLAFYGPPGSGPIIVTEGPMDALSARAAGYRAAAVLGAGSVDATIADRLAAERRRLLLAFDNDPEGKAATTRLAELLDERGARWSRLAISDRHNDLNAWHLVCRHRWPDIMRTSGRLSPPAECGQLPTPPSVA